MLLATDAGIRQQLLDVEQAAGHLIDGIFRITGPEQGPGDGDLGEVDRQQPRAVVDGGLDLGPAKGGAARRPAKMTSSIFADRTVLGPCAPSTQATASTMLDFPLPLGPTTTATPGSNSREVGSANDLKPLRDSDFRNTRGST